MLAMSVYGRLALYGIIALVPALSAAQVTIAVPSSSTANADSADDAQEAAQLQALGRAMDLIQAREFEAAIQGPLADVIAYYETRYGHNSTTRYYSVRSPQEALLYLASAAKDQQNAKALGPAWGEAWFLKGSALNSLGDYAAARDALQHALALAPWNATWLTELAFSHEMLREFNKALELCESAEAMAAFSPDAAKVADQTRAMRCQGYNLTELHRYDEAVRKYEAALKIDPDDEKSKHELEYIRQQRQNPSRPAG